ncbi:MAG: hypothetical protein Q9M82_03150, partial [Mariprofundus sp.]|nr:hypothetical protein [Mariprofundus sp.]
MTKPADTDITNNSEHQAKETATIADVISDSASASPEDKSSIETELKPSGKSHGVRNFMLIVLLIATAVLGSLALSGKLAPLYQSLTSMFQHTSEQQ